MQPQNSEAETGIITALQNQEAVVELSVQEACRSCGARAVCLPDSSGKRRLKAANPYGAKLGDRVAVSEKSNFLLKLSFLQYGLPFLGFLSGIILFYSLEIRWDALPAEVSWFAGGLAGLAFGALIARYQIAKLATSGESFFSISEIL